LAAALFWVSLARIKSWLLPEKKLLEASIFYRRQGEPCPLTTDTPQCSCCDGWGCENTIITEMLVMDEYSSFLGRLNFGSLAIWTSVFFKSSSAFFFRSLLHDKHNQDDVLPLTQSLSSNEVGICSINTLPTTTRVMNAVTSPVLLALVITTHRGGELSSSLFNVCQCKIVVVCGCMQMQRLSCSMIQSIGCNARKPRTTVQLAVAMSTVSSCGWLHVANYAIIGCLASRGQEIEDLMS
jgi:hypothetical protein